MSFTLKRRQESTSALFKKPWNRDGYFTSDIKFAVVGEGSNASDPVQWFTLEHLILHNGRQMPFHFLGETQDERVRWNTKLRAINEELHQLQQRKAILKEQAFDLLDRKIAVQNELSEIAERIDDYEPEQEMKMPSENQDEYRLIYDIHPEQGVDIFAILRPCRIKARRVRPAQIEQEVGRLRRNYNSCDKARLRLRTNHLFEQELYFRGAAELLHHFLNKLCHEGDDNNLKSKAIDKASLKFWIDTTAKCIPPNPEAPNPPLLAYLAAPRHRITYHSYCAPTRLPLHLIKPIFLTLCGLIIRYVTPTYINEIFSAVLQRGLVIIFLTDMIEKLQDGFDALLWRVYKSRRVRPLITAVDNAAAAAIGACKRLHSGLARPATKPAKRLPPIVVCRPMHAAATLLARGFEIGLCLLFVWASVYFEALMTIVSLAFLSWMLWDDSAGYTIRLARCRLEDGITDACVAMGDAKRWIRGQPRRERPMCRWTYTFH